MGFVQLGGLARDLVTCGVGMLGLGLGLGCMLDLDLGDLGDIEESVVYGCMSRCRRVNKWRCRWVVRINGWILDRMDGMDDMRRGIRHIDRKVDV